MAGEVIKSEEQRREIRDYLMEEHRKAKQERDVLERRWIKWRRQREARPEREVKNKPWPGCSNVAVPLAAQNTNTVYASMKAAYSARDPFFTVKPMEGNVELLPLAEALQRYLKIITDSKRHLNLREKNNTIFYDLCSLGTQFVEVAWEEKKWMFKRRDPATGETEQVSETTKLGTSINPLRIEDFITRGYFHDLQKAPWIGIMYRYAEHELLLEESLGNFENIDLLKPTEIRVDDSIDDELHRKGIDLRETDLYEICKFHYFYDIDGDGFPEDIIVWMDVNDGIIVREEFNDLGIRNIVRIPYIHIPYQLYGMGIGWMSEHPQDEVDALHNMTIDGTHLSMLQMGWKVTGSKIGSKEEMYPGKFYEVYSKDDMGVFKFPDLGPTAMSAENRVWEIAGRFVGATNADSGYPDTYAKTRATASGTMFLAQQSGRLSSAIRENTSEGYSDLIQMVVFQHVRNRDRVDYSLVPRADIPLLKQIFSMNVENIPRTFQFGVKTTEIDQTEEAKRQGLLTLTQLYVNYGQQVFQLAPLIFNDKLPARMKETALKFFTGATNMMEKILKYFDEEDVAKYLPFIKDIEAMQQQMERSREVQLQGVRNNGNTTEDYNEPLE